MKHKTVLKKLDFYIEGELPAKESQEIREHLKICPTCRKEYEKFIIIMRMTHELKNYSFKNSRNLNYKIMETINREKERNNSNFFIHKIIFPVVALSLLIFFLIPVSTVETPEISISQNSNDDMKIRNKIAKNNTIITRQIVNRSVNSLVNMADYDKNRTNNYYKYQPQVIYETTPTYIIPVTSARSWKKLSTILNKNKNAENIQIKPIITNPELDTVDLEDYLKSLNYNNLSIESPIYSTDEIPYPNNKGLVLQISINN